MTAATESPTRLIHVVDDDEAVRRALGLLLRANGHAVALHETGAELLAALDPHRAGCVVTDLRMPGLDGLELHAKLRERIPEVPVILISGHADVTLAVRAMKQGAVDVLEKPVAPERLLEAVAEALQRAVLRPLAAEVVGAARARVATLSPRECQVLAGLVEGCANKAIAQKLGISPRTVEIHRAHLMDKLGCRSLAEVVRLALAAGLDRAGALLAGLPLAAL